ncbi:DUF4132 domain-containing protein [Butyrivibrio sp. VCB2006]|uniref:DUF4132 domain-containing protein n=1 Tax=Butyrivibrio sp. VCB2006 TaxID=1280679 RepID=UPI0004208923|nr:DUF4132 domain-containing protein [Butyrivibrio sp. VCB2006]
MAQITNEEKTRLSKLGFHYSYEENQRRQEYLKTLPENIQKFLEPYRTNFLSTQYAKELVENLRKDPSYKPSDFVKAKMPQLFNGFLNPDHAEGIFYTIDHIPERIYSYGYGRRSLRSADPEIVASVVARKLQFFGQYDFADDNLCDYLEGKVSDEVLGYMLYDFNSGLMLGDLIAAEIDFGNERMIKILTDCINGENEVSIRRAFFQAIVKAHNTELYELLGKLLCAAKLQEGLRQSICESMDEGTPKAFMYLLKVIKDNNFIRFSSVKRAFAVWLGYMTEDSSKLERISDKMVDYVYDCLSDTTKRDEYLHSEDSMKMHIALWSIGFYEVTDLMNTMQRLAKEGTRHQILTMSFSMHLLNNSSFAHRTAKPIIDQYYEDPEIVTAYMRYFMPGLRLTDKEDLPRVDKYFDDEKQALHYYNRLKEIYDNFQGKKQAYDPFIFPWYSAEITKGELVFKMAYIACALKDELLTDDICNMFADAGADGRGYIILALLTNPTTELQRKTLTAALCDKAEWTRDKAYEVVCDAKALLTSDNYLQMEEMLKYKAADARENLIKLLLEQEDKALEGSIARLLSDKKEEKRTAALDMILNLSKDTARKSLYNRCVILAKEMESPTTKEQILLQGILPAKETERTVETEVLFTDKDKYEPENVKDNPILKDCVDTFMRYFPESSIKADLYPEPTKGGLIGKIKEALHGTESSDAAQKAKEDLKALGNFVKLHEKDEFEFNGEKHLVGGDVGLFHHWDQEGHRIIPFTELWKGYLEENVKSPEQYLRMCLANYPVNQWNESNSATSPYAHRVYGEEYFEAFAYEYPGHCHRILATLLDDFVPKKDRQKLAIAIAAYFTYGVKGAGLYTNYQSRRGVLSTKTISNEHITWLLSKIDRTDEETMSVTFPMITEMFRNHVDAYPENKSLEEYYYPTSSNRHARTMYPDYMKPNAKVTILACYRGVITKGQMYSLLLDPPDLSDTLTFISSAVSAIREKDRLVSTRGYIPWEKVRVLRDISAENDEKLLSFIDEIYEKVIAQVLAVELTRGDSQTIYSNCIKQIHRVYGVKTFVSIIAALGKETLERSDYYSTASKKGALSRLLAVCIPDATDNADKLRKELEGTDITDKRLVEASLYSTEWLEIVGEYLGWKGYVSGCYYFIAHMNERFDNKKTAVIAKYTPLETRDLMGGAFDVNWFKSVYEELGEKRFNVIYDAAKYISDGSKHSRARKYADAVLGKADVKETEAAISDKRNKDLLMSYPLIPLKGEDDICARYLFLQKFLKESRQFGAQRSASEKAATEIAMQNLSISAGYSDVMRLTLRMETKLVEDMKELFEEREVGGVTVKLVIDEQGSASLVAIKDGKTLKSVPAAIKKDEYIKTLTDAKKKLTEQYRRTRNMFEQSMEDRTYYTVGELGILSKNPVVEPIIRDLVYVTEKDNQVGFLRECILTDYEGKETKLTKDDQVRVAHSFDVYKDGHLSDYQKNLFDRGVIQPFKQLFRELYVKTEEEMEMLDSRRYAGNQIQPGKAIALLKSRRWTPDIEDGIQKVYYKDNIVATIYALADWFSPSDIEAPTMEWVAFYDRKTGAAIKIKDVPDIIFSEVMRDVDLAVSVAHAGGVDPMTTHSTIEMRAALVTFTMPLFKLSNVTVEGSHAHIEGKYGSYTVHLGSGVVHKMGGTMINILPVHSQHRGKLFLPFADEDPKTAEIVTKILFMAQDSKIKDPTILSQIK